MDNKMFCYQCEQTAGCGGCTGAAGVCGKTADVAKLQDELTGALVALARGIHEAPEVGTDTWRMMIEGLFATVTNVDFNEKTLRKRIAQVHKETERLCGQGDDYSMENVWNAQEDIRSLKSLILFGVRGMAAYTHHSLVLGYTDEEVNRFFARALYVVGEDWGMDQLLPVVMEVGESQVDLGSVEFALCFLELLHLLLSEHPQYPRCFSILFVALPVVYPTPRFLLSALHQQNAQPNSFYRN